MTGAAEFCAGSSKNAGRSRDPIRAFFGLWQIPMGLLDRLKQGLSKTREMLFTDVRDLFKAGRHVDDAFLDELEAKLIRTDMGVAATAQIVDRVRASFLNRVVVGDELLGSIKGELKTLLAEGAAKPAQPEPAGAVRHRAARDERGQGPSTPQAAVEAPSSGNAIRFAPAGLTVVMVAGVNGTGKTTSIAKLAHRFQQDGRKVMLAACDTFRAAAVEQLTIWSQRVGCEIVKAAQGADPASVAHDACEKARARGFDTLIVDTAGRLHTQANLMQELAKIHRVVSRLVPGAPHEVLLVLDATTGQNAIAQAEMFTAAIHCTGIVLAKLDGTAKGGIVVAIRHKIDLPVKFVGLGEKIEDLEPFDADAFVEALFA